MIHRFLLALILGFFFASSLFAQDNTELLLKAAKSNDIKAMNELLDKGVDVNAKNHYGVTALFFAIDKNNLETVMLLLERGADPNLKDSFYNETPFGWAIYKKNQVIINAMIDHGADIKDENMVNTAAELGLSLVVVHLLEKGAPGAGNLLLMSIAQKDTNMVRIALPFLAKNDSVLTAALVSAMGQKNEKFIAMLKDAGAKVPAVIPGQTEVKLDETLAGTYNTQDMSRADLVITDGKLTGSFDGSPAFVLKPANDSTLTFADIPGLSVTIQRINGKVMGITLIQPDHKTPYYRLPEPVKKESGKGAIKEDHTRVAKPENWPSFRGNCTSGIADGQHPPVMWDAGKGMNLRWKTYIPGLSHASPVVWGDNVILITAQSSDTAAEYRVGLFGDVEPANDTTSHIWKIFCISKESGKIKWEKKAYKGKPRVLRHVKASQANSTPVTNGEYVVAVFGSEGMVCYDLKGNEKWRKDLGILDAGWFFNEETQWGFASSPVIYKNTVILQCDRSKDCFIAAYDLKTGKEAWKTPREDISSWGTPTVCHGKSRDELVTNASRFIRGYNPATGEELWRLAPNSEITVGSPVFADSLVFVTAGYSPVAPVYAIKTGGSANISIPDSTNSGKFIQWRKKRGGTYMPTPIVYNGNLYTLSNSGTINCYNGSTGDLVYKETIKGGGAFTASPVAADGKIYFTSEEKGVFVIRAGAEYDVISINPVGEICMATPAISDGLIFVRGQHHLFCFGVR
ncbi:MAG: ankyrin repeat domain-containing protein [Bacteroidetes bacterium]|nr:ankyrin repeat domain-containing protein [Bacteroidota bacterium]